MNPSGAARGRTAPRARAHVLPETAETLALDVGLTSFGSPCGPAMTLLQLVRFRIGSGPIPPAVYPKNGDES